jgi:hypothetical protein
MNTVTINTGGKSFPVRGAVCTGKSKGLTGERIWR